MRRRLVGFWVFLLACIVTPHPAVAAGFFLAPRGVGPLSLAGAMVAGGHDVHALTYNPANLSGAPNSVLIDLALPMQSSSYRHTNLATGALGPATLGHGLTLPIPTLGATYGFNLIPGLQFAAALTADYPAMQYWQQALTDPAAAERYGASDFRGTALAKTWFGVGARITPWLAVGASAQLLLGRFVATNVVSACDGVICTQPENPDYDVVVQTA